MTRETRLPRELTSSPDTTAYEIQTHALREQVAQLLQFLGNTVELGHGTPPESRMLTVRELGDQSGWEIVCPNFDLFGVLELQQIRDLCPKGYRVDRSRFGNRLTGYESLLFVRDDSNIPGIAVPGVDREHGETERTAIRVIPNVPNPFYHDDSLGYMSRGYWKDGEAKPQVERSEMQVDLVMSAMQAAEVYGGKGLQAWSNDIVTALKSGDFGLDGDQWEFVEYAIQHMRALPLILPGLEVQHAHLEQALTSLTPIQRDPEGEIVEPGQSVLDTSLIYSGLARAKDSFAIGGFKQPYLLLVVPDREPDKRFFKKSIHEQNLELNKLVQEVRLGVVHAIGHENRLLNLRSSGFMSLPEYAAFQRLGTKEYIARENNILGNVGRVLPFDSVTGTSFNANMFSWKGASFMPIAHGHADGMLEYGVLESEGVAKQFINYGPRVVWRIPLTGDIQPM
ncbi:MAG: hypothetical protein COU31_05250 [Candidatus Magasanikbacteria bacterium CG10_big_fil_rev_8_21_14_0_10_40_10]|uniref:Uncharacterized protein n=2 Tax=Candidatus Magasanikiibacteriota TaxID=1752731 RepID=A0A2M6W2I8_9BACT|nr:MAG: hypothetical protein COV60_01140 [Candidatus Magasanikbacteria bacterium CG11_big_fil_rev_8_21_14_0_20_43_7]PIT87013.1 MAG: hypothetical protein COU31_05250 [Candidatus Magasanikbacteria bacterium CG10_big_fil_rev_8_21_14_0_10_40_10]